MSSGGLTSFADLDAGAQNFILDEAGGDTDLVSPSHTMMHADSKASLSLFSQQNDSKDPNAVANPNRSISSALLSRTFLAKQKKSKLVMDRKYWMSDHSAKICTSCAKPFNMFRRKHHCRICGRIFCHPCCGVQLLRLAHGSQQRLRACGECSEDMNVKTSDVHTPLSAKAADYHATALPHIEVEHMQHDRALEILRSQTPIPSPGTPLSRGGLAPDCRDNGRFFALQEIKRRIRVDLHRDEDGTGADDEDSHLLHQQYPDKSMHNGLAKVPFTGNKSTSSVTPTHKTGKSLDNFGAELPSNEQERRLRSSTQPITKSSSGVSTANRHSPLTDFGMDAKTVSPSGSNSTSEEEDEPAKATSKYTVSRFRSSSQQSIEARGPGRRFSESRKHGASVAQLKSFVTRSRRSMVILKQADQGPVFLHKVAKILRNNLSTKDRRAMATRKVYKSCFVGKAAVTFLVSSGQAATRLEASSLADDVMNAGYFEHVSGNSDKFKDNNSFYRFIDSMIERRIPGKSKSMERTTDQNDLAIHKDMHDNNSEQRAEEGSSKDQNRIHGISGWLKKRGQRTSLLPSSHLFKKRYFILRDDHIDYYKEKPSFIPGYDSEKTTTGTIWLSAIKKVRRLSPKDYQLHADRFGPAPSKNDPWKYGFTIKTVDPERDWVFLASSQHACDDWIIACKHIVKKLKTQGIPTAENFQGVAITSMGNPDAKAAAGEPLHSGSPSRVKTPSPVGTLVSKSTSHVEKNAIPGKSVIRKINLDTGNSEEMFTVNTSVSPPQTQGNISKIEKKVPEIVTDQTHITPITPLEDAPAQLTCGLYGEALAKESTRKNDGLESKEFQLSRWKQVLGHHVSDAWSETHLRLLKTKGLAGLYEMGLFSDVNYYVQQNTNKLGVVFDTFLKHAVKKCMRQSFGDFHENDSMQMWEVIVEYLVKQTVVTVDPDCNSNLPCAAYVVVEPIPGGRKEESQFVDGLVFKKNVLHKRMLERFQLEKRALEMRQIAQNLQMKRLHNADEQQQNKPVEHEQGRSSPSLSLNMPASSSEDVMEITKPSVLLLGSALSFNPSASDQLLSLDQLREGESEYIHHQVNKILELKPDLILCQAEVCRLAQDLLCDAPGKPVAVIQQVDASTMSRAELLLQTKIVKSTHLLTKQHILGFCDRFSLRRLSTGSGVIKEHTMDVSPFTSLNNSGSYSTYAFLEGCPRGLGCAIVLRGNSLSRLARMKEIVTELIFRSYNWKLQLAYKFDRCARIKDTGNSTTVKSKGSGDQTIFEKENIFDAGEQDTVRVGTCIMRTSEQLKVPRVEEYRIHGTIGVDDDGMPLDENYMEEPNGFGKKPRSRLQKRSKDHQHLELNADTSLGSFLITRFSEVTPPNSKLVSSNTTEQVLTSNKADHLNDSNTDMSEHDSLTRESALANDDSETSRQAVENKLSSLHRQRHSASQQQRLDGQFVVEEYFYHEQGRLRFRFENISESKFPIPSLQLSSDPSCYWGLQSDSNRFRIAMWSYSLKDDKVCTPVVEMTRDTFRLSRATFIANYFMERGDSKHGDNDDIRFRIQYFACGHGLCSVSYTELKPFSVQIAHVGPPKKAMQTYFFHVQLESCQKRALNVFQKLKSHVATVKSLLEDLKHISVSSFPQQSRLNAKNEASNMENSLSPKAIDMTSVNQGTLNADERNIHMVSRRQNTETSEIHPVLEGSEQDINEQPIGLHSHDTYVKFYGEILESIQKSESIIRSKFDILQSNFVAWQKKETQYGSFENMLLLKAFAIMKQVYISVLDWKSRIDKRKAEFVSSNDLTSLLRLLSRYESQQHAGDSSLIKKTNNVDEPGDQSSIETDTRVGHDFKPTKSEENTRNRLQNVSGAQTSNMSMSLRLQLWLLSTPVYADPPVHDASLQQKQKDSMMKHFLRQSIHLPSLSHIFHHTKQKNSSSENLANNDIAVWQSPKLDPWLKNRRWNIPGGAGLLYIPIEDNLPGSTIAHALMSDSYQESLRADTSRALEHASDLNLNTTSDSRTLDKITMILSSCVADEVQNTYHISSR